MFTYLFTHIPLEERVESQEHTANVEYLVLDGGPRFENLVETVFLDLSLIEEVIYATDGCSPWSETPCWEDWAERIVSEMESGWQGFRNLLKWSRDLESDQISHEPFPEATLAMSRFIH
jgi:hypothetical protein